MGQYQIAQSRAFPILFTLVVILVFNPLRDRIQALVDRVFFRKEYDYGKIVDKIGDAMTSLLDLGQILKKLTGTFIEDMFIDNSAFMLLNPTTAEYQVYLAEGENKQDIENVVLKRDDPLVKIIEKEKKELTKYDVLEGRQYSAVSEKCAANFDILRASLLVPLVYQEKVIGLFSLGEKKSGKFYNRQDIDLLHAVANQGAVAIENARLFQENLEKQRMEEELAIGRELQLSMLPTACPEIKGFEIAAFSESAREVGGDFYDFIEISESELGIVIGDVTGKSVSGALVMSASRSIFRMLGEDKLTVSESMIRANRRTKKDIKTGMFVALLYAVLSAKDMSLSLCSAGQTQPVFRSAMSGETTLVETQGDTFPLGILDEVGYEETQLKLEAGDKVILYTDGIVEAMNEQEEMFGFDRLIEVIRKSQTKTAESLLEEIKGKVNEFAGAAAQHDDITIIVVQATE
jgi:serine phosphatase RsbU (regulator of sigma subunit)